MVFFKRMSIDVLKGMLLLFCICINPILYSQTNDSIIPNRLYKQLDAFPQIIH